jgi:tetratricopeptide (TPR) repeat protein
VEPENSYALNGLGHLHFDFKGYEEAIGYWERMLASDPQNIKVLTSLGNCYRKLKDFPRGLPYFQKALELEPRNFYALFGLADCCRGMNRHAESLEAWKRILEDDPRNKVIMTRVGDAFRNLGNLEEAEAYYQRALNIEFDLYAVIGLALVNKLRGRYRQAAESLAGLIAQNPRNQRLVSEAAECYLKAGDAAGARKVLDGFLQAGGKKTQVSELLKGLKRAEP